MAGRILIVDDVATNRIVLKVKLANACYDTLQAADGQEALLLARRHRPDLVLLDLRLPDMDGLEICRRLKADPATARSAVVMLSTEAGPGQAGAAARIAALEAGAEDILGKPVDDGLLLARLRSLLRGREGEEERRLREAAALPDPGIAPGIALAAGAFAGRPTAGRACAADGPAPRPAGPRPPALAEAAAPYLTPNPAPCRRDLPAGTIALVASRRDAMLGWKRDLAALLPHRLQILDPAAVFAGADRAGDAPDVYLICTAPRDGGSGPGRFRPDLHDGGPVEGSLGSDTLKFIAELRARRATRHAAICVAAPAGAAETLAMALDLGAADVMDTACTPSEIALRLDRQLLRKREADRDRARLAEGLRHALTDPLTGLHNRRYALPRLAQIAEQARLTGRCFAVMVLDLDRFKLVNDGWGHAAGDAVLREVAQRLIANLRPRDLLARLGGEEFLVVMPDADEDRALQAAERLRRAIEARPVALPDGGVVPITVSVGLAMGGAARAPVLTDRLLDAADRALRGSKAEGRNLVTISPAA
ncbi:diguanylate cyclase [Frigidibacter oleivorans]|uniref:diguanylate cyclase n=1 Tax=Frigidibacter oleivorans TaxID=2487129 RepID=UPI000F8D00A0|nr:diguanylate cyclase [Frigidibacter oleivorans]